MSDWKVAKLQQEAAVKETKREKIATDIVTEETNDGVNNIIRMTTIRGKEKEIRKL
jgi:hypothetical protein